MTDPLERAVAELLAEVHVPGPPDDPAATARPRARRMLAVRVLSAAAAVLLVTVGSLGLAARISGAHHTPAPVATDEPSPTPSTGPVHPVVNGVRIFAAAASTNPVAVADGYLYAVAPSTSGAARITGVGDGAPRIGTIGDGSTGAWVQRLTAGPGGLYAATMISRKFSQAPDRLWLIDPDSLKPRVSVTLPSGAVGLSATSRWLYVATFTEVLRLDPYSLTVHARYRLPGAVPPPVGERSLFSLAATDTAVWAAYGNAGSATLVRLDDTTLAVRGRTALPAGQGHQVVASDGGVWLVTVYDGARPVTADGALGPRIPLSDLVMPGLVTRNGDLIAVLQAGKGASRLVRYDPSGHVVAGPQDLGRNDVATFVLDHGRLWAAGDQHVYQMPLVDPATWHTPSPADLSTCDPVHLHLGQSSRVSEPTGQRSVMLTVTNVGTSPCEMSGYPDLGFRTASGDRLPFQVLHSGDQVVTYARGATVVTVKPGAKAFVLLNMVACAGPGSQLVTDVVWHWPDGTTSTVPMTAIGLRHCGTGHTPAIHESPVEPTGQDTFSTG